MNRHTKRITPVFLFSLPRSGSTLMQRMIATHDQVATTSEPWLLLSLLGCQEDNLIKAVYGRQLFLDATRDFVNELPGGWDDYYHSTRQFTESMYRRIAGDRKYFLDKTPRYHLIADEIVKCFPEGKFILLWRNPLSVISSMLHSYGNIWRMHLFHIDLFRGLKNLIRLHQKYGDSLLVINYEEIICDPGNVLKKVFTYLETYVPPDSLAQFGEVQLAGSLGDKIGTAEYSTLSSEPLSKWRGTLANPLRKAWCSRYLRWIGEEDLKLMGYDFNEVVNQLKSVSPNIGMTFLSDLLRIPYSELKSIASKDYT